MKKLLHEIVRRTRGRDTASDGEALGGDLAYQYGKNGSFAGVSQAAAQEVINAAQFGSQAQTLRTFVGL